MDQQERRRHRRLKLKVPIRLNAPGMARTTDVATGGVRFLTSGSRPDVGDRLAVEMTIPPGDGHWPYPCTLRGRGTVLRRDPAGDADPVDSWAVAVCFDEPLGLELH